MLRNQSRFGATKLKFSLNNLSNNQSFVESLSYLFERGGKRQRRLQAAKDQAKDPYAKAEGKDPYAREQGQNLPFASPH